MAHGTHTHTTRDSWQIDADFWTRTRNAIAFIALVSWIASVAGYFIAPERFFQSYVFSFLAVMFVPLGAMFFLMTGYLTGAAWNVPMRRIAENLMVAIPAGVLL